MAESLGALPPSFSRLVPRVLASNQPLVRLWGWPGSGARELLDAVESQLGSSCLALESLEEWTEEPHFIAESSWILCRQTPADSDLLAAAERLGKGKKLVYAARSRSLTVQLPEDRIDPRDFLLRREEWLRWAEEARSGESAAPVDALHRAFTLTEGWLRPLRWLLSSPVTDGMLEGEGSELLKSTFSRQILSSLDPMLQETLRELASVEDIHLDLWRLIWHHQPEKLAALEILRHGWGLLLPTERPGVCRLPRLMKAWVSPKPADSDPRRLAEEIVGPLPSRDPSLGRSKVSPKRARLPRPAPLESLCYELRLFGDPMVFRRAESGDRLPLEWTLKRAFRTFVFLALAPERRAGRDELIEAIWNDVDPERVRRNFHPTLSLLRRTLGGGGKTLRFRQGQYLLDPAVTWEVDVETFEALITEGESRVVQEPEAALGLWRRAWSLYRGPLLGDEEAPWAHQPREELRRRYLRLLRELGKLATSLGNETLAIDALRSVLLEEPFEERIHLAIMELYSSQGRRDLVRRQYVRLQELLLEELSVEPMSETQEQYHRLMR